MRSVRPNGPAKLQRTADAHCVQTFRMRRERLLVRYADSNLYPPVVQQWREVSQGSFDAIAREDLHPNHRATRGIVGVDRLLLRGLQ